MSVNQWKLLNQVKEYVSKLNDKQAHKELNNVLQKIPTISVNEVLRYFEHVTSKTETKTNEPAATSANTKPQQKSYNLPNVFDSLKIKVGGKKDDIPEPPHKWKMPKQTVTKVNRIFVIIYIILLHFLLYFLV